MATLQQKKLIKLVLENLGKKRSKKTFQKLILEAGYKPSMAKNPYQIFESKTIQEGLDSVVKDLKKQRLKAIKRMNATVNKAKYRDVVDGFDKLTKNIQLLTGKETERHGFSLSDLHEQANKEE